jgi:hypothetical protein
VGGEELIQPTAALVAPDITPDVMQPIDPYQVPAPPQRPVPPPSVAAAQQMGAEDARNVMNTILGRQNVQPQPETAVTAESVVAVMTHPVVIQEKVAEAMTSAEAGASMPRHLIRHRLMMAVCSIRLTTRLEPGIPDRTTRDGRRDWQ